MLERLLLPEGHAIAVLIEDHDRVKRLFDRFEKAKRAVQREAIIDEAVRELKIHASIEEEIFYPTVRKHVGKDLMNEADEEHHVARVLIAELDCDGPSDDHRDAKFIVLAESVRHHIKEEEGEILPKAKELEIDFEALGERMLERKRNLEQEGIPTDREHAMVAASRGRADTAAANARRTATGRRKTRKKSGGPAARRRRARASR